MKFSILLFILGFSFNSHAKLFTVNCDSEYFSQRQHSKSHAKYQLIDNNEKSIVHGTFNLVLRSSLNKVDDSVILNAAIESKNVVLVQGYQVDEAPITLIYKNEKTLEELHATCSIEL